MAITFTPIGMIHTPFQQLDGMPIQSIRSDAPGTVEVFPEYAEGLEGVEEFSHIFLLYLLHQAGPPDSLKVRPFLDDQLHGLFATRHPRRPNPLGISVVRLVGCEGSRLHFLGADMLDGTPLLDIKPYIPEFDHHEVTKIGWYSERKFM
jgi:tRNA (adenine37-N6)-methyltransferase